LSTVPIALPPLRNRKDDIHLIFRKFAIDFSEKYRMPPIKLTEEAVQMLNNYNWPGNIRQLKNITEQISVIESERVITGELLHSYLPDYTASNLPVLASKEKEEFSERDLLYKVLFDMKKDLSEVKKLVVDILQKGDTGISSEDKSAIIQKLYKDITPKSDKLLENSSYDYKDEKPSFEGSSNFPNDYEEHVEVEESLSLEDREKELIQKALEKHRGKRKYAAQDLGISERTLYRKIKEYDLK
jgi:DNA-binding NtrC family response regulator